ncbi:hypothetical protein BKP45_19305 [Anaerobacillus alkalidiazotrophicus]|uniref:Cytosolic protein n=1 Tax=Anaerobacillus alkalidiazotrophicus TaxID=472963 RepID=A0A1S2LZ28_9BACI|nr:spore coat protein YlbD [Anaerobacillus alkalidiazotrophicus]OIJ17719.1 hypothetical protein BKP45_19305 [Anaerobacillus alkalidiazotrophicus]
MSKTKKLHPSVQQFKQFVKKHPLLLKEVKKGKKSLQDFYEEWTILGEKDQLWEKYKKTTDEDTAEIKDEVEDEAKTETENEDKPEKEGSQIGDLLALLKSVNLNDIQGHIQNISGMVASIQGLLQSFQSNSSSKQSNSSHGEQMQQNHPGQHPFNFRHF